MSFKERRGERQEAGKSPKLSKTEEHHQQQQKGLLQSKHTHSKYAITFSPLLFSITPTTNKYLTFLLSVFLLFCFFPNVFCFLLLSDPSSNTSLFCFCFCFCFCFLLFAFTISDPFRRLLFAFIRSDHSLAFCFLLSVFFLACIGSNHSPFGFLLETLMDYFTSHRYRLIAFFSSCQTVRKRKG